MKFALALLTLVASFSASAASIQAARYNPTKGGLEFDLVYGGGCQEHKFTLKVGACLESFPVQCGATLVDGTTNDFCEALIQQTIFISLKEAGLADSYYRGASLTVQGDDNKSVHVSCLVNHRLKFE